MDLVIAWPTTAMTCSRQPAGRGERRFPLSGKPEVQSSSGKFLKFMPYMLAISVGGIPTTETSVRILNISF